MIGKKLFLWTLSGAMLYSSLSYGKNLKDVGFLTPQFGLHTFENRNIDDKFTYGLSLERVFNGWGLGGYLGLMEGNDYKDAALYLSKYYSVKEKLFPFISFGVGANTFNDDKRSLIGPYLAVGFYYLIKGNWNFYFSLKDFYLWKGRNDIVPTVGISYMFGKKVEDRDGDGVPDTRDACPNTPKGISVDSNGCPLDSDNDGVPDYRDECPNTPKGVKVNVVGCQIIGDSDKDGVNDNIDRCPDTPAGVKVDRYGCPVDSDLDGVPDYKDVCPGTPEGVSVNDKGCPPDSDKDGVPDYKDKCPDTPAGALVDLEGCPIDTDNDGVPDYRDECPNTPEGAKVDEKGCMVEVKLEIYFDTDSAVVKPEYYPEIEKIANFLKEHPDMKIEIQGHTDSVGPADYNLKLSQRRAEAVKKILVEKFGISPDRIIAKGYGETKPIAPNDTEEGRAKNRRVIAVPIK